MTGAHGDSTGKILSEEQYTAAVMYLCDVVGLTIRTPWIHGTIVKHRLCQITIGPSQ